MAIRFTFVVRKGDFKHQSDQARVIGDGSWWCKLSWLSTGLPGEAVANVSRIVFLDCAPVDKDAASFPAVGDKSAALGD